MIKSYGIAIAAVMELVTATVVCLYIGKTVDEKYAVAPWGLIVGTVGGSILGLTRFILRVKTLVDNDKE